MGKIVILDENTANKIAAGEVIERPSSVVKELVENSIDAGATAISVEIRNGGISYIKVTDNGSGIDEDDVEIAFERHSTSKIRSSEDLENIRTLGFRGEALASIAAVSSVEMATRVRKNPYGMLIRIKGGNLLEVKQTGCPVGTTLIVRELFYNTPARYKFLKKDSIEAGYVSDIISRIALGNPHVSLKLIGNGSQLVYTPGNNDLLSVIFSIYGKETAKNVVPINLDDGKIKISGYAGKPEIARSNRNHQSFFINGRYIKNKVISAAVDEAYSTLLMKGKHAFIVLHIELNPLLYDVNVHPAKAEVRFSQEQEIFKSVYHAIGNALLNNSLIRNITLSSSEKHYKVEKNSVMNYQQETFRTKESAGSRKSSPFFSASEINSTEINLTLDNKERTDSNPCQPYIGTTDKSSRKGNLQEVTNTDPTYYDMISDIKEGMDDLYCQTGAGEKDWPEEQNPEVNSTELKNARYIGQAFSTFIIMQYGNELLIVDQHAAHERILYEKLLCKFRKNESMAQYLITPVVIELTNQEIEIARENADFFNKLGFIFEDFGNNSLILRSVPVIIDNDRIKESFLDILDRTAEINNADYFKKADDILYTMACKASIKANKKLDDIEVRNIIEELAKLENPYSCPHGRPTIIRLSKYELEKRFKRII